MPGKEGHKSVRLLDFSLPVWAGTRSSCGCLSHTELTWGKEGFIAAGGGGVTIGGNSIANTIGVISAVRREEKRKEGKGGCSDELLLHKISDSSRPFFYDAV